MTRELYGVRVLQVGEQVPEFQAAGMLVTFMAGAPPELAAFCVIHSHGPLQRPIQPGDTLFWNQSRYAVTAVGDLASTNLAQLGHVTLKFDGAPEPELPGTIHLIPAPAPAPAPGDTFGIYG